MLSRMIKKVTSDLLYEIRIMLMNRVTTLNNMIYDKKYKYIWFEYIILHTHLCHQIHLHLHRGFH